MENNSTLIKTSFRENLVNVKGFTLTSKACKGFTLIELLIAIAIVGVMAAFVMNTYPSAQGRARDSQRHAAVKQLQTTLENFANSNNGFYPNYNNAAGVVIASANICNAARLNLSPCPTDPKGGTGCPAGTATACEFRYKSSTGSGGAGSATSTQYIMWSALERPSNLTNFYYVVCSNGEAGYSATVPGGAGNVTCPL